MAEMIKVKLLLILKSDTDFKQLNMLTATPGNFIRLLLGISVYIMGIEDKKYLPETYGKIIGKASVSGYCIKFKTLKDINMDTLETAILDGVAKTA